MSLNTWTVKSILASATEIKGNFWRFANLNGFSLTLRAVDTVDEALALELLVTQNIENSSELHGLDPILAMPFQRLISKRGTRFSGERDPGVLYAADSVACAAAEVSFHQLKFFADSSAMKNHEPIKYTLVEISIKSKGLKLADKSHSGTRKKVLDPDSYTDSQSFARAVRAANLGLISYPSVRAEDGQGLAVLTPSALNKKSPVSQQGDWELTIKDERAIWHRQSDAAGSQIMSYSF